MGDLTAKIKKEAAGLGFALCGVAKVRELKEEKGQLHEWLQKGYEANMNWMHNHLEKRVDPRKLVEGAKSVIVVLQNYYPAEQQKDEEAPVIAKYAYGKDYHYVVKDKLKQLFEFISKETGGKVDGRPFVDSAPVLERIWAQEAGLGWIGKNSLLINNNLGSFYFIGELIVDIELDYDRPFPADFCGSCTRCIDACPTQAIVQPKVIDSNKCISYWTIEHRGEIDEKIKPKLSNRVFGCDICQDVCPWNRKSKPHNEQELTPNSELLELTKQEWFAMDEETYRKVFKKSAVKRAKFEGIKRNLDALK